MAFNRRKFLLGVGGALVGLPFLEGLAAKTARAADAIPPYALFYRRGNGVQQALFDRSPAAGAGAVVAAGAVWIAHRGPARGIDEQRHRHRALVVRVEAHDHPWPLSPRRYAARASRGLHPRAHGRRSEVPDQPAGRLQLRSARRVTRQSNRARADARVVDVDVHVDRRP